MSFAISVVSNVPTITQSSTDTSWSGIDTMISGLAVVARSTAYVVGDIRKPPAPNGFWYRCTTNGTTAASAPLYGTTTGGTTTDNTAVFTAFLAPLSLVLGDAKQYYCGECRGNITGSLTIADPAKEFPIFLTFATSNTATFISGTFAVDGVTPKTSGIHFIALKKGSDNFTDLEAWDGIWSIRGGSIILGGAVKPFGTGSMIFTGVSIVSASAWGASSIRWRQYNTSLQLINCQTYDIGIDFFNMPTVFSVKGFGSEYVGQYVGSSFGGTDALFTISALSNVDGTYDFDNYGAGWVEIYNCAKGASLNVVCQASAANHCVPLFQNLNFIVTNLSGVAQDAVKFTCTDAPVSNSPTTTITTRNSLKTWDFRNPITYTGVTSGGGLVTSTPVLKVWHGTTSIGNLRFPSSTATYRFCGYNVIQDDINVVLGSDTAQTISMPMQASLFLTLTESQANALTGISLVASGASGGTITLTSSRTVAELWQYFRAWKPSNLASNDIWTYDGTTLNVGSWTLVGLEFLTGKITTASATAAGAMSNITVTGPVAQTTPTNLTNVTIVGTLSYNTASTLSITYTNSNVSTVVNNGAGVITISKSGTVFITDYSDPEINFLDSTLTLLNASSAVIYSSASNRDTNTSPGATVTTTLNFKFGSTVSGVPMTGTIYFRVTSGTTIMLSSLTLALGANVLDLGATGQIALLPTITAANVWSTVSSPYTTTGTFGNDSNISKANLSLIPGTGS